MNLDFSNIQILAEESKLFQVCIDLFDADDLLGFTELVFEAHVFHLDGAL